MAWSVCQKMLTREKITGKFKIKVQVQTQESSSGPTGLLDCWNLEFGVWGLEFDVVLDCLPVGRHGARTDSWILSFDAWCLVLGAWCLVFGVWCLVLKLKWKIESEKLIIEVWSLGQSLDSRNLDSWFLPSQHCHLNSRYGRLCTLVAMLSATSVLRLL